MDARKFYNLSLTYAGANYGDAAGRVFEALGRFESLTLVTPLKVLHLAVTMPTAAGPPIAFGPGLCFQGKFMMCQSSALLDELLSFANALGGIAGAPFLEVALGDLALEDVCAGATAYFDVEWSEVGIGTPTISSNFGKPMSLMGVFKS